MSIKNATAKAAGAVSDALEQMVDATMDFADKAMQATKQKTVEAVDITKDLAHKATEATKKTVAETAKTTKATSRVKGRRSRRAA